jgi:hypothetical protein
MSQDHFNVVDCVAEGLDGFKSGWDALAKLVRDLMDRYEVCDMYGCDPKCTCIGDHLRELLWDSPKPTPAFDEEVILFTTNPPQDTHNAYDGKTSYTIVMDGFYLITDALGEVYKEYRQVGEVLDISSITRIEMDPNQ